MQKVHQLFDRNCRNFAPVILFAFNRPSHTHETLLALAADDLAHETNLYVFIDGPRSLGDREKVDQVTQIVSNISGFKTVEIIHRPVNYGLAKNIIEGVGEIISEYGRVIVLEDDILVSPAFLSFMNKGLNYFKANKNVWHISGYVEQIDSERSDDTFLWRAMDCWGWGTWQDRWQHYEKDAAKLVSQFSEDEILRFNIEGGYDFWSQVLSNLAGDINSWAIFWYATIFKNKGLCLSPYVSYTQNIGFDGSGVHCGNIANNSLRRNLNLSRRFNPPMNLVEDEEAVLLMHQYWRALNYRFAGENSAPLPNVKVSANNSIRLKIKLTLKKMIPSKGKYFLRILVNYVRGQR